MTQVERWIPDEVMHFIRASIKYYSLRFAIFVFFCFFFNHFQLYIFSITKFILRSSFERKLLKSHHRYSFWSHVYRFYSRSFLRFYTLKIVTMLCGNLMNGVNGYHIFFFFLQFLIDISFVYFLNIIFLSYFFQNTFLISILHHIFYLLFSYHIFLVFNDTRIYF